MKWCKKYFDEMVQEIDGKGGGGGEVQTIDMGHYKSSYYLTKKQCQS